MIATNWRAICLILTFLPLAACAGHDSAIPENQIKTESSSINGSTTTLTYFNLPYGDGFPWSLINGPDGAIWFGDWSDAVTSSTPSDDSRIGRLASGSITEFDAGPPTSSPIVGAIGANGDVWFSEFGAYTGNSPGAFAYVSGTGAVTSYPAPNTSNIQPRFSAKAQDGNVWYALDKGNSIARVTPSGQVTEFSVPPTSQGQSRPNDIVVGTDGALWFTEVTGSAIARMTTDGTVANVYPLSTEAAPRFLAQGTDGNFWIAENGSQAFGDAFTPSQIVVLSPDGAILHTYAMPSPNSMADEIRPATGGFVFADLGTNAVGFIDYAGNIVEWPLTLTGTFGAAQTVIQGSDGSFYFTDDDAHRIGQITLGRKGIIFPTSVQISVGQTQLVGVATTASDRSNVASTSDNSIATVTPISGFPMNFNVTGVSPGTCTLTIRGKDKPMTAAITVTAAGITTQSFARRRIQPL